MDNKSLDALFTGLTTTGNAPTEPKTTHTLEKPGKKDKALSARAKQRKQEEEKIILLGMNILWV